MLTKLRHYKSEIFWITIFVFGLVLIRTFEDKLFYDPFLDYYRVDTNLPFPKYDDWSLLSGLAFRYFLNMLLSLAIIYSIFRDWEMTKFSLYIYVFCFVLLATAFFLVLHLYGQRLKLELFYIRRFLIQPILLLLFLPGFYFQKLVPKNNNF